MTRSDELRAAAERLVAGIPGDVAPEVVLTGSVSRGVADDLSDVEMLLVTQELLDLETCSALARAAGLEKLGSWGPQGPESSRVSGHFEGIPFELIWWSREYADAATRPGERLSLVERMVDDAVRVLQIVYAINRTWQPTTKRVALRAEGLALKPDRLAERIEEALTEPDPRRALIVMTQLQLDTVALAPSGSNVDRARVWLAEGLELLRSPPEARSDHHVEAH